MSRGRYSKLFDPDKTGWFRILQPGLAYVGAITTFLIAFFFNTVSMWNGQELAIKAASAFISVSDMMDPIASPMPSDMIAARNSSFDLATEEVHATSKAVEALRQSQRIGGSREKTPAS
jgi:hypothetical protein